MAALVTLALQRVVNEAPSQRHYPVQCPVCSAVKGFPVSVQTIRARPGHIRIDIFCQSCREQWFEEVLIEGR